MLSLFLCLPALPLQTAGTLLPFCLQPLLAFPCTQGAQALPPRKSSPLSPLEARAVQALWLPAVSGSRLLNPAAFSLLGSPMIIPFSFFPFPYLCTVDFPSQTRGILAEEPQGHSCLSNPIQDCLFKPEFLVWCWKKTTLSTVAQGVLPLLWSCHPQQVLAFADRHCSPQMH